MLITSSLRQRALLRLRLLPLALVLVPAAGAVAAPVPAGVAAMIDDAARDPETFKAVVATAKRTNPDAVAEIDAQVVAIREHQAEARTARLAQLSPLQGWTGSTEVGVTAETGNTVSTAVIAKLKLSRESLRWQHNFSFEANVKTEDRILSKERALIGYEGVYRLTPRLYAVGIGSWNKDTFAGFNSRFLESVGLGYRIFDSPGLKLKFEAGPALRQTDYSKGGHASGAALRAAGDLKWKIRPWLTFSEVASYVYQDSGSTLSNLTSLTTRFTESFSTRLSFDLQNDENPPSGRLPTDTTTLFTIVYEF